MLVKPICVPPSMTCFVWLDGIFDSVSAIWLSVKTLSESPRRRRVGRDEFARVGNLNFNAVFVLLGIAVFVKNFVLSAYGGE